MVKCHYVSRRDERRTELSIWDVSIANCPLPGFGEQPMPYQSWPVSWKIGSLSVPTTYAFARELKRDNPM